MPIIEVPTGMSDAAMLALVIGFVSPLILNLLISALWPKWVKSLVALAWSAVAGVLTAWIAGAFTGLGLLSTILLILVVSITTYSNFWKQVLPNMQRDSAAKRALDDHTERTETAAIATIAANKVITSGIIEKTVVEDLARPVVPVTKPPAGEGTAF